MKANLNSLIKHPNPNPCLELSHLLDSCYFQQVSLVSTDTPSSWCRASKCIPDFSTSGCMLLYNTTPSNNLYVRPTVQCSRWSSWIHLKLSTYIVHALKNSMIGFFSSMLLWIFLLARKMYFWYYCQ